MVAVLLEFCKAPRNDEMPLQHFFLTAVQDFFFYYVCAACNFFLPKSACRKAFFQNNPLPPPPPPPTQELNGRPLISVLTVGMEKVMYL